MHRVFKNEAHHDHANQLQGYSIALHIDCRISQEAVLNAITGALIALEVGRVQCTITPKYRALRISDLLEPAR